MSNIIQSAMYVIKVFLQSVPLERQFCIYSLLQREIGSVSLKLEIQLRRKAL